MKIKNLILFIVLLALIILIDYLSVRFLNTTPFLAVKSSNDYSKVYKGLFYNVYYCKVEDGSYKREFMLSNDYECSVVYDNDFEIVYEDKDTYDPKDKNEEIFYDDGEYYCKFYGNRSSYVFLKYKNGDYINIKNALRRKDVSVEELAERGIDCEKRTVTEETLG